MGKCIICELEIAENSGFPSGWYRFTFITDASDIDDNFICAFCREKVIGATPAVDGEAVRVG